MRRVVGYVRVSSEGQATEGVSLDAQRVKLAAYCTAMDFELVALEADEGVSAKTLRRPGLQRALAALEEGRADAVLVTKLDRLTRSVRTWATWWRGTSPASAGLSSRWATASTRRPPRGGWC